MIRPKFLASRRIWGLLVGLALISPCLFSAQVFKYQKIKPEKGYLIQKVPFEEWLKRNYCGPACYGLVYQSIQYTIKEKVIEIGLLKVTAIEKKTFPLTDQVLKKGKNYA